MEVTNILINLGIDAYADVFQKNGITMELMEQLDAKLITELIPEIGPRIKFMSYWKTNFAKNEITANTSDIEINNVENNKNVNNSNKQKLENTMQRTSSSIINEEGNYTLHRQNAFYSKADFDLDTMPSINDLLQRSQTGRIILQVSKTKELNESMRNKLCRIIVGYMEDNSITMSNKIAEEISKRIVKTFPSEAKGTYFIEAKRKINTKNKKSIAAKGKLWSCWRNRRYAISKLQKKIRQETVNDIDNSSDDDVSNEDVKENLDWLKTNQSPWEIVLQKWSTTFEYRYGMLMKSSDKKLNNIFEQWPLFKHPNGYKLIQYDFDKMQLSDLVLTKPKWNEFFQTITQDTSIIGKNDNFTELTEKLNLDISEDSKVTIAIQLLSYIIPPKQRIKQYTNGKSKHSKTSIVSSRDSMIRCVSTCGDITRIRQKSNDEAKEIGISVQPYIIVVGQIENVLQSYVSIDEILYSTKSTLEALDVCFKAFHVLHINYPDASKHLWTLIQKGLYKFHTQWDTSFTNTEHILQKLTVNTVQSVQ